MHMGSPAGFGAYFSLYDKCGIAWGHGSEDHQIIQAMPARAPGGRGAATGGESAK
jgi:hypothetical protein